jgi:hypothetical protein
MGQSRKEDISALTRRRHRRRPLRLPIPQNSRCCGRLRLELRYFRVVFRREIQQPFLGERIGVFGETTAALGLFFQGS